VCEVESGSEGKPSARPNTHKKKFEKLVRKQRAIFFQKPCALKNEIMKSKWKIHKIRSRHADRIFGKNWVLLILFLLSLSLGLLFSNLMVATGWLQLSYRPSFFIITESKERLTNNHMFKLERLALAIVEREGWCPACQANNPNGSLTWRHHNPGALRTSPFSVGTQNGFAVFRSDPEGWEALIWDLKQKANGNTVTGLGPEKTLRDLINVWAPTADGNNPAAYLDFVCGITGFAPDMKLKMLLN
jgi:hypothetical protein